MTRKRKTDMLDLVAEDLDLGALDSAPASLFWEDGCPNCGSTDAEVLGTAPFTQGTHHETVQVLQCQECLTPFWLGSDDLCLWAPPDCPECKRAVKLGSPRVEVPGVGAYHVDCYPLALAAATESRPARQGILARMVAERAAEEARRDA